MKSREYLDAGYPIGNSLIETFSRHLIKDRSRVFQNEMHNERVQSMLDHRPVKALVSWGEYQESC